MQRVLLVIVFAVLISEAPTLSQHINYQTSSPFANPQTSFYGNWNFPNNALQASKSRSQFAQNSSQSSRTQSSASSSQLGNTRTQTIGGKTVTTAQSSKNNSQKGQSQLNKLNSKFNKTQSLINGVKSLSQSQSISNNSQINRRQNNNVFKQNSITTSLPNVVSTSNYNSSNSQQNRTQQNKAGSQSNRSFSQTNGVRNQFNAQSNFSKGASQTNLTKSQKSSYQSIINPLKSQTQRNKQIHQKLNIYKNLVQVPSLPKRQQITNSSNIVQVGSNGSLYQRASQPVSFRQRLDDGTIRQSNYYLPLNSSGGIYINQGTGTISVTSRTKNNMAKFCYYFKNIQVCPIYEDPVCAQFKNNTKVTFTNLCNACKDNLVIKVVEGNCQSTSYRQAPYQPSTLVVPGQPTSYNISSNFSQTMNIKTNASILPITNTSQNLIPNLPNVTNNIWSYKPLGEPTGYKFRKSKQQVCNSNIHRSCQILDFVCIYIRNGQKIQSFDFSNECYACQDPREFQISKGPCYQLKGQQLKYHTNIIQDLRLNPTQPPAPVVPSHPTHPTSNSVATSNQIVFYCFTKYQCDDTNNTVCATLSDGSTRSVQNQCKACEMGAVSYTYDRCLQIPREYLCGAGYDIRFDRTVKKNIVHYDHTLCSMVNSPVCGYFGNGWAKKFDSGCQACEVWEVRSYVIGVC